MYTPCEQYMIIGLGPTAKPRGPRSLDGGTGVTRFQSSMDSLEPLLCAFSYLLFYCLGPSGSSTRVLGVTIRSSRVI